MISLFDLFSVGIGPSSSHTVGPMRAAHNFLTSLKQALYQVERVKTTAYGSLAFTGHGHYTDRALLMGLEGYLPEGIDPESIEPRFLAINNRQRLNLLGKKQISFNQEADLIFDYEQTFKHSNAIKFIAFDAAGSVIDESVYFSIGGGFIVREDAINQQGELKAEREVIYPFRSAAKLIELCQQHNLTISELVLANELVWHEDVALIKKKLLDIVAVMEACIEKGCHTTGVLPGKIGVVRRASALYQKLLEQGKPSASHPQAMNWLNIFAMAVNEQNAACGRIVTAPTNGAAGIIPAVLQYYKYFCDGATEEGVIDYLLTAAAIGMLYKFNASISGAEMGCQGEVGVACSMAAAGLTAALGGNLFQIENAAEMAMEHNLGLTCDPVGGLVQIPCIERNAMASNKAVNAAQLALLESGHHVVSLDMVISTMREIGEAMSSRYKETSQGGLAVTVNVTEC